jgi:hypothetical protein
VAARLPQAAIKSRGRTTAWVVAVVVVVVPVGSVRASRARDAR